MEFADDERNKVGRHHWRGPERGRLPHLAVGRPRRNRLLVDDVHVGEGAVADGMDETDGEVRFEGGLVEARVDASSVYRREERCNIVSIEKTQRRKLFSR